jgi:hypothetical protein
VARTMLLIAAAVAVAAVSACGRAAVPSGRVGPPASEAPPPQASPASPGPHATTEWIAPLTCDDWVVGIIDYMSGASGVADILEATRTTEAVTHAESDQVQKIGFNTQIVHEGDVIYFGEWRRAEDGTWLLEKYRACQSFIPPEPEE